MSKQKTQVLFLGDSITRHYFECVKRKLDEYEITSHLPVKWTSQQWKQMRYINRNLTNRKHNGPRLEVDVVHFNFGLHSIKLPNKGHDPNFQRALPEWFEGYEKELINQVDRLRELGVEKVLFSNTTPNPKNAGMRNDKDVVILNEIAREVLKHKNVPYNDLYSHVRSEENYPSLYRRHRRENNCHFNINGNEHLSKSIVPFILENIK
jgi:hypothetical protein